MKKFKVTIEVNGGEYEQSMYITANEVIFDESTKKYTQYYGILVDGLSIKFPCVVYDIIEA